VLIPSKGETTMMNYRHLVPALVLLAAAAAFAQQTPPGAGKPGPSREELEKQFAETLTGATLVGQFTITGMNDGKPLGEDRYTLGTVKKLKEDLWSFEARIQYMGKDVKLPLALPVKWADDTPVISVTKVAFPGLGTYSARVVIYGDAYAGTWSGGDHGGTMFGRIVKKGEEEKPADK
jgi:hypothetical protein